VRKLQVEQNCGEGERVAYTLPRAGAASETGRKLGEVKRLENEREVSVTRRRARERRVACAMVCMGGNRRADYLTAIGDCFVFNRSEWLRGVGEAAGVTGASVEATCTRQGSIGGKETDISKDMMKNVWSMARRD
jgi:hypothetical protein